MTRPDSNPGAGASLAFMLEERRRLRRNRLLLEGLLGDLKEALTENLQDKQRQNALSGWCDPELAQRVERLRTELTRVRSGLFQVQQAIQVASEEIDRLLHCRWQPGVLAPRREAS